MLRAFQNQQLFIFLKLLPAIVRTNLGTQKPLSAGATSWAEEFQWSLVREEVKGKRNPRRRMERGPLSP